MLEQILLFSLKPSIVGMILLITSVLKSKFNLKGNVVKIIPLILALIASVSYSLLFYECNSVKEYIQHIYSYFFIFSISCFGSYSFFYKKSIDSFFKEKVAGKENEKNI